MKYIIKIIIISLIIQENKKFKMDITNNKIKK